MKMIKSKKLITLIVAAAMLSALALGSCKNKPSEENPNVTGQEQTAGENAGSAAESGEGENKEQNQAAESQKPVAENPDAPAVTVKSDEVKDSVSLKDSGETVFTKNVQKLRITSAENSSSESVKKISSVMSAAYDRNEEHATDLKNDCLDYLVESGSGTPWAFEATYETERNDAYALSFTEEIYMNAGGVHPSIVKFGYNFEPSTGKQVMYEDVVGEDGVDALEALIKEKISDKYGAETLEQSLEYIGYDETLTYTGISKDSWHFTKDGISVVFSQNDIAVYAAGEFDVDITKEELAEISPLSEKYFG